MGPRSTPEPVLGRAFGPTLPEELGKAATLLADTGYFSEANVQACAAAGIDPLIAMGRQPHHQSLAERFAPAPARPDNPTPVEAMAHRLKTPEGKKLYGLRRQMPGLTQADAGAYASGCRSRCSASSSRRSGFANSCYAASIMSAASGAS